MEVSKVYLIPRKNVFLIAMSALMLVSGLRSQSVSISATGTVADASAMLDIQSSSKGLLVPRMKTSERLAINNPANGLLVFDQNTQSFWYNYGQGWTELTGTRNGLRDTDKDTRVVLEETPDDDIIRFISRNSEVLIIDSTGNIGIGDNSPSAMLTLAGGSMLQHSSSPIIAGSIALGQSPSDLHVSGHHAFVVDFTSDDLKVIDVSDPGAPAIVGTVFLDDVVSLFVSGRYAYVATYGSPEHEFKVIDISNPTAPAITGSMPLAGTPTSIYVSGTYAYVVNQTLQTLTVIDISNPFSPVVIGSLDIGSGAYSLEVSGRYAYYVDFDTEELVVIDVTDPSMPTDAGSLQIGADPISLSVSGRYAYVVDQGSDDLKVIDIANPTAPALTGTVGVGGNPTDVFVSGRYAFVVDSDSDDLKMVDVADPTSPVVKGSLGLGPLPFGVYVSGRYAYVVDRGTDDLKVIDISGIETTSLVGHSIEAGYLHVRNDISVQGQMQVSGGLNVGAGGIFSDGSIGVNGSASKPGGGSWSASSDCRLKNNISDYRPGLDEIRQIRPVTFRYNALSGYDTTAEHVGVIAQELQPVAPYMVDTFNIAGSEYLQVDNSAMTYMLINAVKELAAQNEKLGNQVVYLSEEVRKLSGAHIHARATAANKQ